MDGDPLFHLDIRMTLHPDPSHVGRLVKNGESLNSYWETPSIRQKLSPHLSHPNS